MPRALSANDLHEKTVDFRKIYAKRKCHLTEVCILCIIPHLWLFLCCFCGQLLASKLEPQTPLNQTTFIILEYCTLYAAWTIHTAFSYIYTISYECSGVGEKFESRARLAETFELCSYRYSHADIVTAAAICCFSIKRSTCSCSLWIWSRPHSWQYLVLAYSSSISSKISNLCLKP